MASKPIHLRDVSVHQAALEKALLRAEAEGLDVRQTAEMLAEAGFGHAHRYPVSFTRNTNFNIGDYAEGDLVIKYAQVGHLMPNVHTHEVSQLWRVLRMHQRKSPWGSQTMDHVVDLRNVRTGRVIKSQYQASFCKAEIND